MRIHLEMIKIGYLHGLDDVFSGIRHLDMISVFVSGGSLFVSFALDKALNDVMTYFIHSHFIHDTFCSPIMLFNSCLPIIIFIFLFTLVLGIGASVVFT